jgi:hypothetical protein
MSMMPAVRSPYSAGNAPVISVSEEISAGQRLPEDADALGQDDAVEPVLQAVVLAAHVKLAEGILRHVRRLHDHLVEQRVVAARGRRDRGIIDGVGRGAGLGLDAGAGLVERTAPGWCPPWRRAACR